MLTARVGKTMVELLPAGDDRPSVITRRGRA